MACRVEDTYPLPVTFPLYTFYDLQCDLWQLKLSSRSAHFTSESSMLCTRQCMHVHKYHQEWQIL